MPLLLFVISMEKPDEAHTLGVNLAATHAQHGDCMHLIYVRDGEDEEAVARMLQRSKSTAMLFGGTSASHPSPRCFYRGSYVTAAAFFSEAYVFSRLPMILERFTTTMLETSAAAKASASSESIFVPNPNPAPVRFW